ncbi:unnamed protein product [Brassicogethes aeneus]|uniref:Uncharacterized protein n=1 Tax=Brassicogethes aeneus TaxID=1431903 RepID=A0A9P0B0N6_BRAAE|nr:unnamed protein product [Brassicogethes aeneus]
MDSFYDAPRRSPAPVAAKKINPASMVPEVSLLFGAKQAAHNLNSKSPYMSWKMKNMQQPSYNYNPTNKENFSNSSQNTSHMFKKQVRFESPVLQQRPSLTYEPFLPKNDPGNVLNSLPNGNNNVNNIGEKNLMGTVNGQTFDQIYMANVPNRHLDLSIVEPMRPRPKLNINNKQRLDNNYNNEKVEEKVAPKSYREYMECQKKTAETDNEGSEIITDIYSYMTNKNNTPKKLSNDSLFGTKTPVRKSGNTPHSKKPGFNSNSPACQNKPMCENMSKKSCNKLINQINNPEEVRYQPVFNNLFENQSKEYLLPSRIENAENQNIFMNHQSSETRRQSDIESSASPQLCREKYDSETQTNNHSRELQEHKPDEPTLKDLLKIISQQNEQMLLLQKQVASLMQRDHHQKQLEPPPRQEIQNDYITSTQHENFASGIHNTPKKRLPKFSIDLMTSFEVSFRPPNKNNFVNHEPRIQEITETESAIAQEEDKKCVDSSMHLDGVNVRESCPSPEPTVKINEFEDYESSDEDESVASEIGVTFYKNLMGQVNDILKRAQIQTKQEFAGRQDVSEKTKTKTMNKVKEATLKHLKSIGVSLSPQAEESVNSTGSDDSKNYSPKEVSFAVKQLLMKYLPDEHLAKISHKPNEKPISNAAGPTLNSDRPEFSIASLQYMKKYNLIEDKDKNFPGNKPKVLTRLQDANPKLLDISKLKQQPKLL